MPHSHFSLSLQPLFFFLLPSLPFSKTLLPTMFEARLEQGALLKKLLDAVKELVTDANFDCSATGFGLQAMDSSHVSLVSMMVRLEEVFWVVSSVFFAFVFRQCGERVAESTLVQ